MPKSHTTEAEIAWKVCSHIANDLVYRDQNFDFKLKIDLFKKYFNPIIHAKPYCIYHGNPEQRNQYNMFFRLVRGKVSTWLKRKKLAKEQATQNDQTPAPLQSSRREIHVPQLDPGKLRFSRDLNF